MRNISLEAVLSIAQPPDRTFYTFLMVMCPLGIIVCVLGLCHVTFLDYL